MERGEMLEQVMELKDHADAPVQLAKRFAARQGSRGQLQAIDGHAPPGNRV
jgi:hypothetical protein